VKVMEAPACADCAMARATINARMSFMAGLLLSLFLVYHIFIPASSHSFPKGNLSSSSEKILDLQLDIASSESKQKLGLSGRESLDSNAGMLFVFDPPSKPGFWMKDMNFALDIIWLDQDSHIVQINENLSPATFPNIFTAPSPVKYVLEITAGKTKTLNLIVGDKIKLPK